MKREKGNMYLVGKHNYKLGALPLLTGEGWGEVSICLSIFLTEVGFGNL